VERRTSEPYRYSQKKRGGEGNDSEKRLLGKRVREEVNVKLPVEGNGRKKRE